MKKKLAVLLSLFSIAAMAAFSSACAGTGTGSSSSTGGASESESQSSTPAPEIKDPKLVLSQEELSIDVYTSATLTATFEDATESAITWTSSDESVVKVVDGVVTAYKSGTAVVTATAGELVAVCEVTVGEMVGAPEFPYLVEELSIVKGASESLDVTLEYNGAELTVATVEVTTEGDKVSVSEDNEVVALAYGEQTITVTAKFGDTVIATATVKVTVEEFGQLVVDLPENKLAMKIGEDGYALSQIKAILNVGEVENPEYAATSTNEEVAKIEDGKICPVGEGEAEVTIVFQGELASYESIIYVTVTKNVVNKEVNFYVKGSGEETSAELGTATIDLTATEIDLSTVSDVLCGGESVEFSVDGAMLTLTNAPGGYQYYTLVTPAANYVIDGVIYGKAISTAEELLEWREKAHSYLTYVVLEKDIDLGGAVLSSVQVQPKGTLDGLGHTISNFSYSATSSFVHYVYGTLKNLQFVNAVQDCTGSGNVNVGLLGNNNMGTIENVFAKVVIKNLSSEAEHWGVMCYYLSAGSKISNVIVHVETEGSVPKYVYGIYCLNPDGAATAVNANVICEDVKGAAGGSGAVDCGFYTSETAMAAVVDVSAWGGYWQVSDDGKAYMSDYSQAEKNISVTSKGVAKNGETISFFTTSYYPLTYAFAETVTGVTMSENNEVVIGEDAVVGSVIKVVVTCEQFPEWSTEFEFTIERTATKIAGSFLAQGDAGIWNYKTGNASFDLTDKGVDMSAVTAVEINGVAFTDYEISGNTLKLKDAPGGSCEYTLKTASKDYTFTGCIYAVGISTVDELNTWRKSGYYGYAVLLNDIDYQGATLEALTDRQQVNGTLDGRGYSISNFTTTNGFVSGLFAAQSAIKNVAFKNVTQDCASLGKWPSVGIFGKSCVGTIENVYIQIKTVNFEAGGEHCAIVAATLKANSVVKNVVLDMSNENKNAHYAFNKNEGAAVVQGVVGSYGETKGASENVGGWSPNGTGFYNSIAAMIEAEAYDELQSFTSPYWVIDAEAGTIELKPLDA